MNTCSQKIHTDEEMGEISEEIHLKNNENDVFCSSMSVENLIMNDMFTTDDNNMEMGSGNIKKEIIETFEIEPIVCNKIETIEIEPMFCDAIEDPFLESDFIMESEGDPNSNKKTSNQDYPAHIVPVLNSLSEISTIEPSGLQNSTIEYSSWKIETMEPVGLEIPNLDVKTDSPAKTISESDFWMENIWLTELKMPEEILMSDSPATTIPDSDSEMENTSLLELDIPICDVKTEEIEKPNSQAITISKSDFPREDIFAEFEIPICDVKPGEIVQSDSPATTIADSDSPVTTIVDSDSPATTIADSDSPWENNSFADLESSIEQFSAAESSQLQIPATESSPLQIAESESSELLIPKSEYSPLQITESENSLLEIPFLGISIDDIMSVSYFPIVSSNGDTPESPGNFRNIMTGEIERNPQALHRDQFSGNPLVVDELDLHSNNKDIQEPDPAFLQLLLMSLCPNPRLSRKYSSVNQTIKNQIRDEFKTAFDKMDKRPDIYDPEILRLLKLYPLELIPVEILNYYLGKPGD